MLNINSCIPLLILPNSILGNFELTRARILYDDLYQAQKSLVLVDNLHLLYLVTPYDVAEQIKPNKNDYYNIVSGFSTHLFNFIMYGIVFVPVE